MQQILAAQGEGLVRALVRALCDTCPRRHLRALAGCLYQLLSSPWCGDAALQWLVSALRAHDLPGAQLSVCLTAPHQLCCTGRDQRHPLSFSMPVTQATSAALELKLVVRGVQVCRRASFQPRTAAVSIASLRGVRHCP